MSVPKRYCVFDCDVLHQQRVPVHRFPHPERESELFAAWVAVTGDKLHNLDNMKIYNSKRICDQHFDHSQKTRFSRLIRAAVPTINLKRVRQSISSIVSTDHNYCIPRRELQMLPLTAFITNTSGPSTPESSAVQPTVYPTPSVPTSTTCPTSTNTVKSSASKDSVIDKNIKVTINDQCDVTTEVITDPCYDTNEVINEQYDDTTEVITDPCDDANVCDDVVVPNTPMPESVELRRELFSWEKTDTNTIIADDTMVSSPAMEAPDLTLDFGDVSMYDEWSSKDDVIGSQFSNYQCNNCGEKITGSRYTCVQCADWDLCAACEARAAHATHYVLRVPGQRPYNEVKAILMALRQHILSENMFLTETIASVKVKEEVKDEEIQVIEGAPELEGDPLGAWNVSQHDYTCDTPEHNPEPNENSLPRNRRTSIDSLGDTQNITPRDNSPYRNLVTSMTDDDLMETDNDSTRSDDDQTSNTGFDYSEPIKIIDIEKLTRTHEARVQDSEQNDPDLQITKENSVAVGRLEDYLDTCKPKEQNTGQENLVDTSPKTPLKTIIHTHINDKTHNEHIKTQNKRIGTDNKGIGAYRILRKTKIGLHSNRIGTRSTATPDDKIKKRYKILMPPGTHWQDVLIMLKSRVTVPLIDVMRKS